MEAASTLGPFSLVFLWRQAPCTLTSAPAGNRFPPRKIPPLDTTLLLVLTPARELYLFTFSPSQNYNTTPLQRTLARLARLSSASLVQSRANRNSDRTLAALNKAGFSFIQDDGIGLGKLSLSRLSVILFLVAAASSFTAARLGAPTAAVATRLVPPCVSRRAAASTWKNPLRAAIN
jgi:hypothetical protein